MSVTDGGRFVAVTSPGAGGMMLIECDRCRAGECRGCLVGALLDTPDGIADLTPGELRAIEVFELAGFEVELLETPPPPVAVPVHRRRDHVA